MELRQPKRSGALAEQAYVALRDAILSHQLEPGDRLSVPELARQLGISRSPTREAITRIAHEGLARLEPHQGAVVADIRSEDLVEIYALREVLEGLAARLAAQRASDDDVTRLRQLMEEHEQAAAVDDVERHYELDQRFHSEIRRVAGNRRLVESLDVLQGQIRIGMFTTHRSLGGLPQTVAEHRAIFNAVAARDPEAAEHAGRAHVARLQEELRHAERTDAFPS
ncbi:GntR family transcriptional regulator [Phytoactinopolyspora halophila]|uniref:GntR family transcriptional regulator n=1 Tax=Phytoactinopolyspora halophila TaxID=1981511 RepID=UPI00131447B3|nr:GntR family transcriptional regulator [Phytoactinopolyspora halophila]